jgi:hypothetical protein
LFEAEGEDLGGAKTCSVEEFEESAVAEAEGSFYGRGIEDASDLCGGERGGEFAGKFGRAKSDGHIGGCSTHAVEVGAEAAEDGCFET